MKASKLIEELQLLTEKHGDVEVSVVLVDHEYSMDFVDFVPEGPLPKLADRQGQNPPKRIILVAEDKLDDVD